MKKQTLDNNTTLGLCRDRFNLKGKDNASLYNSIRKMNRYSNAALTSKPCANCMYDIHVELCHIKPIAAFPDEATIGDVNHSSNVIQLCRNCHWELDNGYLSIEFIEARMKSLS